MTEKLYPKSFIYVWATFEHQVRNKFDSQKGQDFFSEIRRSEKLFWQVQGHQQASASTVSIKSIQKTTFTVNAVEHQKTVDLKKLEKRINWFPEVPKHLFYHYLRESKTERCTNIKTYVASHC